MAMLAHLIVPSRDGKASTLLSLTQENNATDKAREHSEKNWGVMLTNLKKLLEG